MGSLVRTSDRVAVAVEIALDRLRAPDDEVTWDVAPAVVSFDCDDCEAPPHTHTQSMVSVWLSIKADETTAQINGSILLPMYEADDDLVANGIADLWSELTFARQARTLADLDQNA